MVLEVDSQDSVKAYIIKYTKNSEAIYIDNHESYSIETTKEVMPIKYYLEEGNKTVEICVYITTLFCNWGGTEHNAGPNCTESYIYAGHSADCFNVEFGTWSGGGGGGGGTSSSSDDGPDYDPTDPDNHGNGSGNVDTVLILEEEVEEQEEEPDPCKTLKDLTDDTYIQTAINNVKPSTALKIESAYEIERRYSSDTETYSYSAIHRAGTNFVTPVQVGGHTQGQVHNHPKNGLSIPSWGDIRWTYACEENNTIRNNNTAYNIVVVREGSSTITYAVTIDDFVALGQQIEFEMSQQDILDEPDEDEKIHKINAKFDEFFNNVPNNSLALEKKYLEVFANYGTSLFKMNEQTNNWEKLELENPYDPNNPNADNSVINKPCIN